jgi:hypothetical protein
MNKPIRLHDVSSAQRSEAARALRAALFQRCRAAIEQMEDDISGFALVVWDREGNMRSAYDATNGPIRAPLVPTLAADALNRHVAVMISAAKAAED